MGRIGGWIAAAIGLVWTIWVFITSVSPDEASSRASGWMTTPFVQGLWAFSSHRVTIALTMLIVGAAAGAYGWKLYSDKKAAENKEWAETIGQKMVSLAGYIERATRMGSTATKLDKWVAEWQVILVALQRRHFKTPISPGAAFDVLVPYLRQVGAHLNAGDIDSAKASARLLT